MWRDFERWVVCGLAVIRSESPIADAHEGFLNFSIAHYLSFGYDHHCFAFPGRSPGLSA
jgi:hypothetical protein